MCIKKMNYKNFVNTSKKVDLEIFQSHRTEIGKLQPTEQIQPCPLFFVNKLFLEDILAHSFTCCLWLIWGYNNRVE